MSDGSNFNPQSFGVIGAGPVGCIVACFLSKGGYEVTLWILEFCLKAQKICSTR
jgi:pyruvate/2-oxoglutarate dehydrogenase complex dihydrolipoamide dehydrogenase (E3) component